VSDAGARLLDAVRGVAPAIRTRADEIESGRRLPLDLLKELRALGAFRMLAPRSHGGLELDFPTSVEVLSELAAADGATGWTVMIGCETAQLFSLLPRASFDAVYANGPDVICGGAFAPQGTADVLAKEKLCPVVAILPYKTFHDAVAKAKANLLVEGAGHSAAVHSNDEANIREAGVELPVSRLVVNQPSSLTAGGSLTNGFAPTTTLGCGSWGGNSISENLDYKHLMNVSRIGKVIANKKVPTDEEIFS